MTSAPPSVASITAHASASTSSSPSVSGGTIACARPSARHRSSLLCVRAVPTTCAPSAVASWSAAVPTPEPTACTSTHSPGWTLRVAHERVVRGHERLGRAAHRDEVEAVGHGRALRGRHRDVLGLRAAAGDPEHPGADLDAARLRADRLDDARELQAGDVGRRAGRRGVVAGELHEIGPVQAGAVHPHDHEVVGRLRVGPFGDLDPAVDDRCGSHVAPPPPRASRRCPRLRHDVPSFSWPAHCGSSTRTGRRSSSTRAKPTPCSRSPAGSTRRPCRRAPSAGRGCSRRSRSSICSTRRRRIPGRATSSSWPTKRRRCTSTSIDLATDCRHARWRDPLLRRVARRDRGRRPAGPAVARRCVSAKSSSASNDVGDVGHERVDVGDRGRVDVSPSCRSSQ